MNVNEVLREIDAAKDESLTEADKRSSQYESRRGAYEKALREVRAIADDDAAQEFAAWIEATIREDGQLPRAREVHQKGADVCRERGHSVTSGSWLGA